jgi:hypothetical protein
MNANTEFLMAAIDWVCRFAVLGLLMAWGLSFITTTGGRWLGLKWLRLRNEHILVTLLVTSIPVMVTALLLWPGQSGKGLGAALSAFLVGGELILRFRTPVAMRQVDLSKEENLFTSRLYQPHHYTLFEPRPNLQSRVRFGA